MTDRQHIIGIPAPWRIRCGLQWVLIIVAVLWMGYPSAAHAQLSINQCSTNAGHPPTQYDYSQKAVACLQGLIEGDAITIMGLLSDYMKPTVAAMCVLVIAFYGIRVIGGTGDGLKGAFAVAIRMAVVVFFSYNMGGLALGVFALVDELIQVTSNFYPWGVFDTIIGQLLGFGWGSTPASGSGTAISQGLIGLLSASVFSTTVGIYFALMGAMVIMEILFLIFRSIFIYISAITVIAILVVISPLIIPLALFSTQEKYVKAWYCIIISAVLTPALLFALLYMFLIIFMGNGTPGNPGLIPQIFHVISTGTSGTPTAADTAQNADYHAIQKYDQPLYEWLLPADPQYMKNLQYAQGNFYNPVPGSSVPHHIDPQKYASVSASLRVPKVDFGSNSIGIMTSLMYLFIELLILVFICKSLAEQVPQICGDIAQMASSIPMGPTNLENTVRGAMSGGSGSKGLSNKLSETVRQAPHPTSANF